MRESVIQRRQTLIEEESRESSATPTEMAMANNCGGESVLLANDHECNKHTTDIASTTTSNTTTTTITTTNNVDNTNAKDTERDNNKSVDSNINVILIYNTRL